MCVSKVLIGHFNFNTQDLHFDVTQLLFAFMYSYKMYLFIMYKHIQYVNLVKL